MDCKDEAGLDVISDYTEGMEEGESDMEDYDNEGDTGVATNKLEEEQAKILKKRSNGERGDEDANGAGPFKTQRRE